MGDITRELRLKAPAEVVPNRLTMVATAIMVSRHSRHQMVAAARRAERRGEIRILAPRPRWSDRYQQWELPVQQLYREPRPWFRTRWFIAAAVLSVLGSLLGAGYWVLTSLAAAPLALFCLGAFAGLLVLVRAGRSRPSVRVIQSVEVK